MASAALRQAFIQPACTNASQTLRHVADQFRGKWPKLGAFIDDNEGHSPPPADLAEFARLCLDPDPSIASQFFDEFMFP